MGRSLKKGPYVNERLLAKVEKQQRNNSREPLKTWARDCTIAPEFVGVNKPLRGVRPGAGADSTWRFARETDSALVRVRKAGAPVRPEGDVEKFLFYRGLGEFDLPLSIKSAGTTDDVQLTLRNRGAEPLTAYSLSGCRAVPCSTPTSLTWPAGASSWSTPPPPCLPGCPRRTASGR